MLVDGSGDLLNNATVVIAGAATIDKQAFRNHNKLNTIYSTNGTQAIALPAAADVPGKEIFALKTGSAGAITFTPASGTIGGSGTYATMDAQNDCAILIAVGTDWVVVPINIA